MNEAFTTEREVLIGMHFEMPRHPMGAAVPWSCYAPDGNHIGTRILDGWILRELAREGLNVPPPNGVGTAFGELNSCTGCYSVTEAGKGLRVIDDVVRAFYAHDGNDPVLELAWFCGAEGVWRMWRPVGSTKDFGRHLTPEARARGERELCEIYEAMRAAVERFRNTGS